VLPTSPTFVCTTVGEYSGLVRVSFQYLGERRHPRGTTGLSLERIVVNAGRSCPEGREQQGGQARLLALKWTDERSSVLEVASSLGPSGLLASRGAPPSVPSGQQRSVSGRLRSSSGFAPGGSGAPSSVDRLSSRLLGMGSPEGRGTGYPGWCLRAASLWSSRQGLLP
jgi:hypothetical protein